MNDLETNETFIKIKQALKIANQQILRLERINSDNEIQIGLKNSQIKTLSEVIAQKDITILNISKNLSEKIDFLNKEIEKLKG